ncbi:MAG: hypothetical protein IJD91_01140 [Clostridia bacterium]|nr:hypothetical protein [Clostridia bacterium]
MKEITYKVNCPRDFGEVYDMTIQLALQEDGSYLPSPCRGCDNMNGLPQCTYCVSSLFKMSRKDPTMQSYAQPITP